MKPYVEIQDRRIYLPQEVDLHRFEVCSLSGNYILCPKVKTRYRQATGIHIEIQGNDFTIPLVSGKVVRRTFPLEGATFHEIRPDWSKGAAPSFTHSPEEEQPQTQAAE